MFQISQIQQKNSDLIGMLVKVLPIGKLLRAIQQSPSKI